MTIMAKTFACKDIGMNCAFTTSANSGFEMIPKVVQHMKDAPNMQQVAPDMMTKIQGAIKGSKSFF